jgi:hypothetical protein
MPTGGWNVTNLQRLKVRLWPLVVAVAMITLVSGCGDAAAAECQDCPNLALQPACEEAAAQCDVVSGEARQTCLDEARQLCE